MRSGKLDRSITIETATLTKNSIGEKTKSWSTFKTVWAQVTPMLGKETLADAQLRAPVMTKFRIRYLAGLKHTMRILHNGEYYDIQSIIESDRNEQIEILARVLPQ